MKYFPIIHLKQPQHDEEMDIRFFTEIVCIFTSLNIKLHFQVCPVFLQSDLVNRNVHQNSGQILMSSRTKIR